MTTRFPRAAGAAAATRETRTGGRSRAIVCAFGLLAAACGSTAERAPETPAATRDAGPGPIAARRALTEPALDCVYAVEDARALRGALEHVQPTTEIRLVRGTFVLEEVLRAPVEPVRRLRIVGQGAGETILTWRGSGAMLTPDGTHPVEIEVFDLTLACPRSAWLASDGEGVLSLSGAVFEGESLAEAPRWVVRWHAPRPDAPPPPANAAVQSWEGRRTR